MESEERLKGIGTFVRVVETGSFAHAASLHRQTRSAVAKSVARLERRLGITLFNRTTRSLSLTEQGQVFYERCRRALQEIDEAEAVLEQGRRELIGRLRVSMPLIFGRHIVAPILLRLAAGHPRLELQLSFNDRVVDLVEEGFDLAIRMGTLRDSATLAARVLGRSSWVLAASPAYFAKHPPPRRVEDFTAHDGIVYSGTSGEAPWLAREKDGTVRELPIRRRIRYDDVQAMTDAAVAGAGITRLPRWVATPLAKEGALKLIWEDRHSHEIAAHAVWPHTRHLPLKTRAAIDALAEGVPRAMGTTRV
jgi:DNA-binding transcriptional LysR family regulator